MEYSNDEVYKCPLKIIDMHNLDKFKPLLLAENCQERTSSNNTPCESVAVVTENSNIHYRAWPSEQYSVTQVNLQTGKVISRDGMLEKNCVTDLTNIGSSLDSPNPAKEILEKLKPHSCTTTDHVEQWHIVNQNKNEISVCNDISESVMNQALKSKQLELLKEDCRPIESTKDMDFNLRTGANTVVLEGPTQVVITHREEGILEYTISQDGIQAEPILLENSECSTQIETFYDRVRNQTVEMVSNSFNESSSNRLIQNIDWGDCTNSLIQRNSYNPPFNETILSNHSTPFNETITSNYSTILNHTITSINNNVEIENPYNFKDLVVLGIIALLCVAFVGVLVYQYCSTPKVYTKVDTSGMDTNQVTIEMQPLTASGQDSAHHDDFNNAQL